MKFEIGSHPGVSSWYHRANCKTNKEKPPLGLMPRFVHEERRFDAVMEAINRYFIAERPIPIKWIEEYNDILTRHEK